jgi:uncharacterized protein YyaL (SSP411 family)
MPIEWLSWTVDAFDRARAQQKPVLLSIVATWCECCDRMDATTYADPDVAAIVHERFASSPIGGPTSAIATCSAAGRRRRS